MLSWASARKLAGALMSSRPASRTADGSSGVTTSCGASAPSREEKLAGSSSGPLTCRLTSPLPLTALVTSHCAHVPAGAPVCVAIAKRLASSSAGLPSSSVNAGDVRTCSASVVGSLTRRRRIARVGAALRPCTRKRTSVRLTPPATSTVLRPLASGSDSGARVVSAAIVATACAGAAPASAASSVAPAMVKRRILEASMPGMRPHSQGSGAIARGP